MFAQFKYSIRPFLKMRLSALGAVVVVNLILAICGVMGAYRSGGQITAVVTASLLLTAVFAVNIIADFETIQHLFSSTRGNNVFLTPAPRWQILLGRVVAIVLPDVIGFVLGTAGIVVQALILAGIPELTLSYELSGAGWALAAILVNYLIAVLVIFFACTLSKTLFFAKSGRALLGIAGAAAILYLFSLLDLLLIPFGSVYTYGVFVSITVYSGFTPGMLVYLLLQIVKAFALFYASAHLMERKMNL